MALNPDHPARSPALYNWAIRLLELTYTLLIRMLLFFSEPCLYIYIPNVPCFKSHIYFMLSWSFQPIRPISWPYVIFSKILLHFTLSYPHYEALSWRTTSCQLFATAYSIHLHSASLSGNRLFHPPPEGSSLKFTRRLEPIKSIEQISSWDASNRPDCWQFIESESTLPYSEPPVLGPYAVSDESVHTIFSSYQPCQLVKNYRRFSLMIVPETSVF